MRTGSDATAGLCLLVLTLIVTAGTAVSADDPASRAGSKRPNIVLILADDLGWSDLGCYGGEIATPHLDKLASKGLQYTQFYNTARCWPTRAALMTGFYPQQVGMDPIAKTPFPENLPLLPHRLREQNYRSYHSGKWHIFRAARVVKDGGFDHSYWLRDHSRSFTPQRHIFDDQPLPVVEPGSGYYSSTAIADFAIQFLEEHTERYSEQPFFLYLAFDAPHFPLHAPADDIAGYADRYLEGWDRLREERVAKIRELGLTDSSPAEREPGVFAHWSMSEEELRTQIDPDETGRAVAWQKLSEGEQQFQATKMAIHAAMVDRMDQEVGRVVDQVRGMGNGGLSNTLFIFLSDNGASAEIINRGDRHDRSASPGSAGSYLCLGPGFSTASNTPWRRHKSWVHEGGVSTPLIVSWPTGITAAGELRTAHGHCIDLFETIVDIAGCPETGPPSQGLPMRHGESLVTTFDEDVRLTREEIYFRHGGHRALRVGDWKVLSDRDSETWSLFDLSNDRAEQHDLAAEHPELTQRMVARWESLDTDFEQDRARVD
ncbi:arylsulfatase [Stratiformator vulcanicus]|nr:arylsulfatase [Stratiformator vulcanicus]